MSDDLKNYVKPLLEKRITPEEIKKNLVSAGWKEKDVDAVLAELASALPGAPLPPPPKPPTHSMVEIFINILSFLLLGITATAVGTLYFQIINRYFPDPLASGYYYDPGSATRSIHYAIAALLVGFPIYVWAVRFWFKRLGGAAEKTESRLSKWLTYIVLLIAAGTIIGDLIVVIFNFLQGELSPRFLLKALTILVITGFIFGFYALERKKIQYKKDVLPGLLRGVGGAFAAVVALGIVLGFFAGGTPQTERLRKFDNERANDLRQIASGITSFALDQNRLPEDFEEMRRNSRYGYYILRTTDPETKKPYEYRVVKERVEAALGASFAEFELCAEFSLSTREEAGRRSYPADSWASHGKGRTCNIQTATLGVGGVPKEKTLPPLGTPASPPY